MAIYRRNMLVGSSLRIIYNFIGGHKGIQTQCREMDSVKSECKLFHLVCCLGRGLASFGLIMSAIQTVLLGVTRKVWAFHSFVVDHICSSVRVSAVCLRI